MFPEYKCQAQDVGRGTYTRTWTTRFFGLRLKDLWTRDAGVIAPRRAFCLLMPVMLFLRESACSVLSSALYRTPDISDKQERSGRKNEGREKTRRTLTLNA